MQPYPLLKPPGFVEYCFANPWAVRPTRPGVAAAEPKPIPRAISREQFQKAMEIIPTRTHAIPGAQATRQPVRALQPPRNYNNTFPAASPSTLPFAPGPNYSIPDSPIPALPPIPAPPSHPPGYRLPRPVLGFDKLPQFMRAGSLELRREAMAEYVKGEIQKWITTLDEMIAMEDAFKQVWQDEALQKVCHDPGRKLWRMKYPDDGLVRFLKTDIDIIALRRKIIYAPPFFPRHWAELRTYCAFVGRYALELPASEYVYILKVWEVQSITESCKILVYGLRLPLALSSSVCLLVLNDPYFFDCDPHAPGFLCQALTPDAFNAYVSFEHFSSPAFQIGCPLDTIIDYLRSSLRPEEEDLRNKLSATFFSFTANFPKLLSVIEGFEPTTATALYKRVLDDTFTTLHYQLVKDVAPAPWAFWAIPMDLIPKLWLAMPEQQEIIAREIRRKHGTAIPDEGVPNARSGEGVLAAEAPAVVEVIDLTGDDIPEPAEVTEAVRLLENGKSDGHGPKEPVVSSQADPGMAQQVSKRDKPSKRRRSHNFSQTRAVVPERHMCLELDRDGNPLYTWEVK